MSDYLDPNNEELLKDFFAEAEQQVETLESNILVIENDPSNHEAVDEIFRAAHTLKGGSATVEMTELSEFTHKVEDVLDAIRSDKLSVDEDVVDVLLSSIDIIKAMLEARTNGSIYGDNIDEVVSKLKSYIPENGEKKSKPKPPAGVGPEIKKAPEVQVAASQSTPGGFDYPPLSADEFIELKHACSGSQKLWRVAVRFDQNNPMNSVGGIQVFAALKALGSVLKTIPDFDALYEDDFHENVFYYLASDSNAEKIEDTAFLGDVTVMTDAQIIDAPKENAQPTTTTASQVQPAPKVEPDKTEEKKDVPAEASSASGPAKPEAAASNTQKKDSHTTNQQGSVLRVDSRRIDYLLNLVSEAVIAKATFNQLSNNLTSNIIQLQSATNQMRTFIYSILNQIPHYIEEAKNGCPEKEIRAKIQRDFGDIGSGLDGLDGDLKALSTKLHDSTQNLGRITGDLQEGVMKIRMVPINQIFSRFPRVVRDLQRDLHKKIELDIEGEDTELDKSVVEDLLDPIMHCVRNSVDHGIEMPDVRVAAGKPETGHVLLKASNEGNLIVIDIEDDGAGIDAEKVRQKAIEKGLIHPDKVLSESECHQLIFEPGFSTAAKISNISGRGVGLDVVKTMIEKLKGTVTVTSEKGKGSKFSICIPLTLAIIQGLLVKVGREIYSIPIASVIESRRIPQTEIKTIDNYEVLNVRGEVISVLRLSRLFGIKDSVNGEYCNIVIVGSKDKKVGIMVDSLVADEDIVIKPLQDQFTNAPGIAGASILGDGSVSLIIDVSQLLDLSVKQDIAAQELV
ncbi:MAG: chemotaxis protein CheA [Treponema sp.]|nr:chemotaxis protein CheA [Treponema sp.]